MTRVQSYVRWLTRAVFPRTVTWRQFLSRLSQQLLARQLRGVRASSSFSTVTRRRTVSSFSDFLSIARRRGGFLPIRVPPRRFSYSLSLLIFYYRYYIVAFFRWILSRDQCSSRCRVFFVVEPVNYLTTQPPPARNRAFISLPFGDPLKFCETSFYSIRYCSKVWDCLFDRKNAVLVWALAWHLQISEWKDPSSSWMFHD